DDEYDQDETISRNQILCITLLCKVFLQYLNRLLPLLAFHELWMQILQVMQIYLGKKRSEIIDAQHMSIAETCLEHLKNILLVMHANGAFQ
ncbi:unnamed protein product, partial [Heterosigma akashiwo]